MEKKKTYVLTLSEVFPKAHNKAGEPTGFKVKFALGQGCPDCDKPQDLSGINISVCNSCVYACSLPKLHTIRSNYPLWEKRIKEVQEGKAFLSVRQWSGKPYRSKQVEIARLSVKDGVGVQLLEFTDSRLRFPYIDDNWANMATLAQNDGLSLEDWVEWFRGYDLSKPMAVIHFTKFRY